MSDRQHFASLDGLRGIAAITVVALHALDPLGLKYLTPHAALAVDFFFCLSGFVIGYAYEQRLLTTMSFSEFAVARIIRLYPLILVGLLLGSLVFVAKAISQHQLDLMPKFLIDVCLGAVSLPTGFDLGEGWSGITPLNTPAWSLFFEVLANFVYASFVRRLTKTVLICLLIFSGLIVFAQAYAHGDVSGGNDLFDLASGLGRVFFPFLCGVFLFRRRGAFSLGGGAKFGWVFPIAILAVLLLSVPSSVNKLYESLAVVVAFPLIIGGAASHSPGPRATSIYLFLGTLSYPLYILHYPLLRIFSNVARTHDLHGTNLLLLVVAEILCAMVFALVVGKFFDVPVRKWLGEKFRAKPRAIDIELTARRA